MQEPAIIRKEMGITHKEFYAGLPALLEGIPYAQSDDTITFQWHRKTVEITVGPEGRRPLSRSIGLPVTPVTLRFLGCADEQIDGFVRHFLMQYMKGGG